MSQFPDRVCEACLPLEEEDVPVEQSTAIRCGHATWHPKHVYCDVCARQYGAICQFCGKAARSLIR